MPQSEPESGPWERYATQDQNGAGSPKPVSEQEATAANMPSWMDIAHGLMPGHPTLAKVSGYIGDMLQGAGTEAGEQVGRLASYVSPRGGQALQPLISRYTPRVDAPAEGVGRAALDTAEFLLPGSGEAKSAEALGQATSVLPRIVQEGARILPSMASAGGVSALQGGSFTGGALAGGAFGAAGRIGESVALRLLEKGIGVSPRQLSYGARPGEEALALRGATPAGVSRAAAERAKAASRDLHQMLTDAGQRGVAIDLSSARTGLDYAIADAEARNSQPVLNRLLELRRQVTEFPDGSMIPSTVDPIAARALKQGLDDSIGAWERDSEGAPKRVKDAAKRARRSIDQELDNRIPGHKQLNDKLAGLLSAAKPKGRPQGLIGATLGTGSGLGGSILRYGAIPGLGYYEARRAGATMPEAMATGLALEGLNAPATAIGTARALNSPITMPLLRGLTLGTYHGMTPSLRPDTVLPPMLPAFLAPEDPNRMPKPIERSRKVPDIRVGG